MATGYTRVENFTTDKNAGLVIKASKVDAELNAIKTSIDTIVAAGGIAATQLAADSVTTVKILDANVTTAKIADDAIDNDKLSDDAVTTAKILDGTILNADINSSAGIDATKLADGSITNTELQYINTLSSNVQTQINAITPIGAVPVDETDTDTTLNKVVSNNLAKGWEDAKDGTFTAPFLVDQQSTPSTPASGKYKLYFKSDGLLYMLNSSGTETQVGGEVDAVVTNATDIFAANVRALEEHGTSSILTEKGFVDELVVADDLIDETNSSNYTYDATDDFYQNEAAGTGLNSDKDYTTETNYVQQEWTNALIGSSQVTVTGGTTATITGTWPTNCAKGRISFDSGTTWFDIASRDSATVLTLATSATNATTDFIIRLSEITGGNAQTNSVLTNSNVKALLHLDNGDNYQDYSGNGHVFTASGGGGIVATESKFGGYSWYMNGGHIEAPASSDWYFAGDFTIDFWWNYDSSGSSPHYMIESGDRSGAGTSGFWSFQTTQGTGAQTMSFEQHSYVGGVSDKHVIWTAGSTHTQTNSTWIHFALERISGVYHFYADGTHLGTSTKTTDTGSGSIDNDNNGPLRVSGSLTGSNKCYRYLDELRIVNGQGMYGGTGFSVETSAYAASSNPTSEYISICDTEAQDTTTSHWLDINSGAVTETLNSQNIDYWMIFDPVASFGAGTEVKIFNQTGSVWRTIAVNTAGTWQYNNNASHNATETLVNATYNDMLHAVSQAVSTQAANRMDGTELAAITDGEWEAANGWSTSIDVINRGATLQTSSASQNPLLSQFRINYDADSSALSLQSKQWTGTGGTPTAPASAPNTMYLFVVDQQTTGTPTYYVSRDGGTTWKTVTFDKSWSFDGANKTGRRASVDMSAEATGTDPRFKVITAIGDDFKIHAVGLQTKA